MATRWLSDLVGTAKDHLRLGFAGVRLKNSSGNLLVRNSGDSADAQATMSKLNVSGDAIDINSDAAGSGADWKYTIQRPSSGMGAAVVLTLPPDDGSPGQVLQTDGAGNLTWTSAGGSTASSIKQDSTALAFGTASPVSMFSTGAADIIELVEVYVDTIFNGTAPSLSIGIAGTTSKYMAAGEVDLKTAGSYEVKPGLPAQGAEALIATYVADSSSAGAARILVNYSTPS